MDTEINTVLGSVNKNSSPRWFLASHSPENSGGAHLAEATFQSGSVLRISVSLGGYNLSFSR